MWKYALIGSFLFTGCSYYEINPAMCEKIGPKDSPEMIEKCRNYSEKEATKAFNKTKTNSSTNEDALKFKKEESR